jgi:hypothetical protein
VKRITDSVAPGGHNRKDSKIFHDMLFSSTRFRNFSAALAAALLLGALAFL